MPFAGSLPAGRPELNSSMTPAGVIRPIALVVPWSVNQMLPSGPAVIDLGSLPAFRPVLNSWIAPAGVIRPIAGVVPPSTNHTLPSGPRAIPAAGLLPGFRP